LRRRAIRARLEPVLDAGFSGWPARGPLAAIGRKNRPEGVFLPDNASEFGEGIVGGRPVAGPGCMGGPAPGFRELALDFVEIDRKARLQFVVHTPDLR
jgi:hypothetical protein